MDEVLHPVVLVLVPRYRVHYLHLQIQTEYRIREVLLLLIPRVRREIRNWGQIEPIRLLFLLY